MRKDNTRNLIPMTFEGCVVRISDIIAYLGRDIEDAIKLGIIEKKIIPKEIMDVLGTTNHEIVNTIISDIITNSLNKNYLHISDDKFNAIKNLKKFNYENIYNKIYNDKELNEIKSKFEYLYEVLLQDINNQNINSKIYNTFYKNMNEEYKNNTSNERVVLDYIAGMTDKYFIAEYNYYQNR